MKKLYTAILLSMLSLSIALNGLAASPRGDFNALDAPRSTTRVYIEPQNGTATVGGKYTIMVKIANVTNLYAIDIQIRWGTAVLKYSNHTVHVGNATLNGVLNPPVFQNKDIVDETASIPLAAPGTTYWVSYVCFFGAPPYNVTGSAAGIVVSMTFDVIRAGECDVYFTKVALSDNSANPIPSAKEDGYFYQASLSQIPVAAFTFSPDPAVQTRNTTFDASDSHDLDPTGDIALYIWNFGDGTPIASTSSPTIIHNFTTLPSGGYFNVELTVLDDQGGGSQSKPTIAQVAVVHPRPVAEFQVWPEDLIAVVNKTVQLNASDSYDPDPEGSIVNYFWNFGDGNLTTTSDPIVTHSFQTIAAFVVRLVVEDSEGLNSTIRSRTITVVETRDIEAVSVSVSPEDVKQGEAVSVNATIANLGEAEEDFTITAYYNSTMANWIPIGTATVSDFPAQYAPRLEFTSTASANSSVNRIIKNWVSGASSQIDSTAVQVGNDAGYWTINPGLLNTAASSIDLVTGLPLTTGGWIWEDATQGATKLRGIFEAGNWSFQVRLKASEVGVTARVWARALRSSNPDPHAAEANVTALTGWTALFPATAISTTVAANLGNVTTPEAAFNDEYLIFEFQLEVTSNSAVSPTANVVFQVGGSTGDNKAQIRTATYISRNRYQISWNTEFATPGKHVVKIVTSEVPHETNLTNNEAYSNPFQVTALSTAVPPLDVSLDVGAVHFRGELAEFYVLITSSGRRVDATLNASLVSDHVVTEISPTTLDHIATGLYVIEYPILMNAPQGTYTLVVDASRLVAELNFTQAGSALASFLVSPSFTSWNTMFADWNATLIDIQDDLAIIMTSLGQIKANLTAINATLSGLIVAGTDTVLAEINTALGPILTSLDTINATVTDIQGDTATISSSLGDTNSSISALQSTVTLGLVAASVLSAIAVVLAVLILLRVRKLTK